MRQLLAIPLILAISSGCVSQRIVGDRQGRELYERMSERPATRPLVPVVAVLDFLIGIPVAIVTDVFRDPEVLSWILLSAAEGAAAAHHGQIYGISCPYPARPAIIGTRVQCERF